MLKTSLLAAAAFAIVAVAAPIGAYAQLEGSRQIVIEPAGGKGAGTGGGGGLGTGGGGGAGTGGGKKTPAIIAPVVVNPGNEVGPDIATGNPTEPKKLVVDPTPIISKAEPATIEPDPLDAIIGPAPTETVTEEAPLIENAPAAIASTTATVASPDDFIVFLKAKGYQVAIDRKEKDGDYVLVVSSEQDKVAGYLIVVDDADGKVIAKQKIDLADYGYAQPQKYAKPQKYAEPEKYEYAEDPYEGEDAYEAESGYEKENSYEDKSYKDNSYGGGSGSGY